MSDDLFAGIIGASIFWAIVFIGFVNYNYGLMQRAFAMLHALKINTDATMEAMAQQLANTEAVRDAWKVEAEKYKRRLLELGHSLNETG